MPVQDILAPISLGELIDKITILQIKTQHLQSTALENVKKELQALESTLNNLQLNIDPTLILRLKEVNQELCRSKMPFEITTSKSFGDAFIHSTIHLSTERLSGRDQKEINTAMAQPWWKRDIPAISAP